MPINNTPRMNFFIVNHLGVAKNVSTQVSAAFLQSLFNVPNVIGVQISDGRIIDVTRQDNPEEREILAGHEGILIISPQPQQQLQLTNVERMFQEKKFTLLMKCVGAELSFSSLHWTSPSTLNVESEANNNLGSCCAKFATFNSLPISELLLVHENGCYSWLQLPNGDKSLLHYTSQNVTTNLVFKGGADHPLLLAHGASSASSLVKFVPVNWRINATRADAFGKFGARIGGFFTFHWDDNYGSDSLGNKCAAECAGVGINDETYSPYVNARKSFGVRQAHDQNSLPNGGQVQSKVLIYGR